MLYAIPTSRVIFIAKINVGVFSLGQDYVWTYSVLGDRIYEVKRVTYLRHQGLKTWRSFTLYFESELDI